MTNHIGSKRIPTTNSETELIVTKDDFEFMSKFSWHIGKDGFGYTTIKGVEVECGVLVYFYNDLIEDIKKGRITVS